MKTNLEIAQELWNEYKSPFKDGIKGNPWTETIRKGIKESVFTRMQQHKEDCESFWKDLKFVLDLTNKIFGVKNKYISNRFEDLSATIKFYESKGIK